MQEVAFIITRGKVDITILITYEEAISDPVTAYTKRPYREALAESTVY